MLSISGSKITDVTYDSSVGQVDKETFDIKKINYEDASNIGKSIKNDIDINYKLQPFVKLTEAQERLNERYDDAMWICTFPQPEDESILAAYDKKRPVGLKGLSSEAKHLNGYSEIKYIVAHPMVSGRGCGKSMIERAVNFSVESGNEGRVAAFNVLLGAEEVYKKWGFESKGGCMLLDPSTSRKWTNENGRFHVDPKVQE